ncbi:succinyldiaminopimelate transaminase [Acidihalobacter ferrooxydans]|uniref:Succinyldiaminopimelate transaminase n=1 Tax=Acidihalobacter ferrooxydans TaxID=1765967 RepID=A0A1P8UHI4_9GAMM|nr:succinyldiaminopimelate transaminase [Acidihalobacter ferrooxydans]APZ43241.1 succinyldiaminopimelate transaminase [Acidihalobacter ferrooxydans]
MNPELESLQPYPFERLAALFSGIETPPESRIALSIGEPKHATPGFIREALLEHLHGLANYPTTRGTTVLRTAIADWLTRRFDLPVGRIDPERQVLPVNGTREALFAFAQAVVDRTRSAQVLMPNPFYQIYEGAALLAGAEPVYLDCTADTGFLPDLDAVTAQTWQRCQLVYLCTPGNPAGAVASESWLQHLIELAEKHDFLIASDECYSDIYLDENAPPPGLLGACERMGNTEFKRCMVFHSLSKRSNAPGLRSGFVAGDAAILAKFLLYRTYHGCSMPPPTQAASIQAWSDDAHVRVNRDAYRAKFQAVLDILDPVLEVSAPAGGFYLWPRTPIADTDFARELYARENVVVLPGRYLSRAHGGSDPGVDHVRIALVAPVDECIAAAQRIRHLIESL